MGNSLISGNIITSLFFFAVPVLLTLFLQAMYGGADLIVVGQFSATSDISAVSTGSMIIQTITMLTTALSMGVTVLVGQKIGENDRIGAGKTILAGLEAFLVFAGLITAMLCFGAGQLASWAHAPKEAFASTCKYIIICGMGTLFITAYNLLGAIFRGLGDAKTPMYTVCLACILNIVLDLVFIAIFHWGAIGAAFATVLSQGVSVLVILRILRKRQLPFVMPNQFKPDWELIKQIINIGLPVGIQELLVGFSFIFIQTIGNSMGVVASAGIGIAEKICAFVMLVPSSYMQSVAAFTAQNVGAKQYARARKALYYAMGTSIGIGLFIALFTYLKGNLMTQIFTNEEAVILASHDYLKAYAIDTLLTSFMFCFIGYFDGFGYTKFVMMQGIVGALFIRIPVAYYISQIPDCSLFAIGLATPTASFFQILMCIWFFFYSRKYI